MLTIVSEEGTPKKHESENALDPNAERQIGHLEYSPLDAETKSLIQQEFLQTPVPGMSLDGILYGTATAPGGVCRADLGRTVWVTNITYGGNKGPFAGIIIGLQLVDARNFSGDKSEKGFFATVMTPLGNVNSPIWSIRELDEDAEPASSFDTTTGSIIQRLSQESSNFRKGRRTFHLFLDDLESRYYGLALEEQVAHSANILEQLTLIHQDRFPFLSQEQFLALMMRNESLDDDRALLARRTSFIKKILDRSMGED